MKFSKDYRSRYGKVNSCPACSFNAKQVYGFNNPNSILEIHHIVPLKYFSKRKKTKENDVTFLCPNCHRAIHKMMAEDQLKTISIKEFKKNIK